MQNAKLFFLFRPLIFLASFSLIVDIHWVRPGRPELSTDYGSGLLKPAAISRARGAGSCPAALELVPSEAPVHTNLTAALEHYTGENP